MNANDIVVDEYMRTSVPGILAVMIQNEMTDMEIDTLQIGTHPLLTSSPVVYPIISATVDAITKWYDGPVRKES